MPDERRAELIGAAVADDLTAAEADELAHWRARDPGIDAEIAELTDLSRRLGSTGIRWTETGDTAALGARILARTTGDHGHPDTTVTGLAARRARRRPTILLAAACLVLGIILGAGVPALASLPPTGPPGTLGATEQVAMAQQAAPARVDADLVAHTWGTEAVLDATGLDVGATYVVVFIAAGGQEYPAGEILGSTVPIHCSLNAAVLRAEAARLEVRGPTGSTIASADLPAA